MATTHEYMGRNQAARYIQKNSRTFGRMVERGDFEPSPDGRFLKADLDEWLEAQDVEEEKSVEKIAIGELREALKQATDHVERMVELLEKPQKAVLNTVEQINERLLKRLEMQEANSLEYMKTLGEFYMQREEREAMREEAKARSESIRTAGKVAAQFIPTLMAQATGKSAVLAHVQAFASSLTDEQKAGLGELSGMFEGEQREHYLAMMRGMGIASETPAEVVQ